MKADSVESLNLDLEGEREHIQPRSQGFSTSTHAFRGTGRREILGSRLEHVLTSCRRDTKSPQVTPPPENYSVYPEIQS